jgi:hypothetical protein
MPQAVMRALRLIAVRSDTCNPRVFSVLRSSLVTDGVRRNYGLLPPIAICNKCEQIGVVFFDTLIS